MMVEVMSPSSSSSSPSSPSTSAPAQAQSQTQTQTQSPQPQPPSSSSSSSSPPPQQQQSPSLSPLDPNTPNPNTNTVAKRQSIRRSLMSTRSHTSNRSSRPASQVFPVLPSSLSYALVRDFAYPQFHPLHVGPSPEPASSQPDDNTSNFRSSRRLSDPPIGNFDSRGGWGAGPWGGDGGAHFGAGDQLPSTSFDDDAVSDDDNSNKTSGVGKLAKNHRKSKSAHESRGRSTTKRGPRNQVPGLDNQGFFSAANLDDEDEDEEEDQDEQEQEQEQQYKQTFLHPTRKGKKTTLLAHRYTHSPEGLSSRHQNRLSALEPPFSDSSEPSDAPGGPLHHLHDGHAHRPTSTSLDESFAGPSLALYSFVPENSNELALREGQIIQVGYRHGQGWLVAMDMDSGEQGLVPEEYVRLLSEIEGWGEHLEGVEEEETETEAIAFDQGEEEDENESSGSGSGLVVVVGDHDDEEGEGEEGEGEEEEEEEEEETKRLGKGVVGSLTTAATQSSSSDAKASSSDKDMLETG